MIKIVAKTTICEQTKTCQFQTKVNRKIDKHDLHRVLDFTTQALNLGCKVEISWKVTYGPDNYVSKVSGKNIIINHNKMVQIIPHLIHQVNILIK